MKDRTRRVLRIVDRWVVRPVLIVIAVLATLILVRAFDARRMPDLKPWHDTIPPGDFTEADLVEGFTFEQYLQLEEKLFEQLDEYMVGADEPAEHGGQLRYQRFSPQNAANHPRNFNRSYELVPDDIRGGILLIHGLTDSPYSMRSVAELFSEHGYYVLAMRVPGHGTVPAALLESSWKDWAAAVTVGARHVRDRIGGSRPFCVGGYSNGGALCLHYTLAAIDDETARVPDRIFLFSPAVGVTAWARAARWDRLYGFIPSSYGAIERQFGFGRGAVALAEGRWKKAVRFWKLAPFELGKKKKKKKAKAIKAAKAPPELQLADVLRRAPFGDPLQVKVGSSLMSIRRKEALLVRVELE